MFRGPLVMDGYYGNEEATRRSIEPGGWLHSGDIATMDEDGYFTIVVDRKTDMILTAGFNVYPAESRTRPVHASGRGARRRHRSELTRSKASWPRPTSSSNPTPQRPTAANSACSPSPPTPCRLQDTPHRAVRRRGAHHRLRQDQAPPSQGLRRRNPLNASQPANHPMLQAGGGAPERMRPEWRHRCRPTAAGHSRGPKAAEPLGAGSRPPLLRRRGSSG